MPTPTTSDHGTTHLQWAFQEYEQHERSTLWYVIAIPATIAMLVWALLTQNYLFAVIIVFAAFILLRQHRSKPQRLTISITEDGVDIAGRHFYAYKDLRTFWLVYDPPRIKRLVLGFKSGVRPALVVDLEETNPLDVRTALARYVPEDLEREDEPTLEALARLLKL